MGTPDEHCWPGVRELPDWKETFPKWRPRPLQEIAPTLDPMGLDLLSRMLVYDPATGTWAATGTLHTTFYANSAAVLRGGELRQIHLLCSAPPGISCGLGAALPPAQ